MNHDFHWEGIIPFLTAHRRIIDWQTKKEKQKERRAADCPIPEGLVQTHAASSTGLLKMKILSNLLTLRQDAAHVQSYCLYKIESEERSVSNNQGSRDAFCSRSRP